MSDNSKNDRGIFGKGYYIALILCAAAIGISGYLYYRNTSGVEDIMLEAEQTVAANATEADIPVVATKPAVKKSEESAEETAAPTERSVLKTVSPVSGETVASYSMDCLSYNQTTRDWRTHNGVDISAESGTSVVAAADGVVYTTYSDDALGTIVVIRHDGGYTTTYASLAEELSVQAGDTVTAGQVIGTVGTTALLENALPAHVHFSVSYQGTQMDPAEFLTLGT